MCLSHIPHVITYRVSEIRAVNLLEDLCDAMSDYTLVTPSSSDANITEATEQQQQQQQGPAWVKYKGEGSVAVSKSDRWVVMTCTMTLS